MELDISIFGCLGDYLFSLSRETAVFKIPKDAYIVTEINLLLKHRIFRSFQVTYSYGDIKTYIAHFDL